MVESVEKQMADIFMRSQKSLLNEFLTAVENKKNISYVKNRLDAVVAELQTNYSKFQTIASQENYLLWWVFYDEKMKKTVDEIQKLEVDPRIKAWAWAVADLWAVHIQAVENLIASWNAYLEESLRLVEKTIITQFNEYQLLKTFETIWQWVVESKNLVKMKNDLVSLWKNKFPYFTDRGWRKRTLERYWEMLIRTETAKAYNVWILTQWVENWVTKFQRDERSDACPICTPHRNEIWDVVKKWFPTLLYHPNCRWYWKPILE